MNYLFLLSEHILCKESIVIVKKFDFEILTYLYVLRSPEFIYVIFGVMYACVYVCVYACVRACVRVCGGKSAAHPLTHLRRLPNLTVGGMVPTDLTVRWELRTWISPTLSYFTGVREFSGFSILNIGEFWTFFLHSTVLVFLSFILVSVGGGVRWAAPHSPTSTDHLEFWTFFLHSRMLVFLSFILVYVYVCGGGARSGGPIYPLTPAYHRV